MKTKFRVKTSVSFFILLALGSFNLAIANEDAILNSDPIDINGYVKEAPVSDHELETVKNELKKQQNAIIISKEKSKKYKELSRTTEKLADTTEELIDERSESQETIDRFNKKIECLMNKGNNDPDCDKYVRRKNSDQVNVQQAAATSETQAEQKPGKMGDVIKILPYSGVTAISSDNERLEANLTAGLRVESDLTERFSAGIGFNYMRVRTADFGTSFQGVYRSGWNYNDYSNFYNGGREVEYTNMAFELYSKYFITKTERFRPYVGGGISYNRSQMNYADNRRQQFGMSTGPTNNRLYQFGDEEIIASHIGLNLVGGTEILFGKNFGLNLEVQYARGLGGNLSSDAANLSNAPDQERLRLLNDELIEANMFSFFAGLLVLF